MFPIFRWVSCALVLLSFCPSQAADVRFGGQVRPRFESHDPGLNGSNDTYTSMRVRAHLSAVVEDGVGMFVELQDVRLWGEETSTLSDFRADNLDLRQGYFELRGGRDVFSARVGRQSVKMGSERLIGAVDWAQQGRSFDGIRLSYLPAGWMLDVIGMRLSESSAPGVFENGYLVAGHLQLSNPTRGTLDLLSVYNRESKGPATDQVTVGLRWESDGEVYTHHVEGYYQTGDRRGTEVTAYMFGAGLGVSTPKDRIRVAGWYDYLSGDDDPVDAKVKTFDTLFATNHKFYGYADVFTDIPSHTGGLGLQDLGARLSVSPSSRITMSVDGHVFYAARKGIGDSRRFGQEVDFSLSLPVRSSARIKAGLSYFYVGDALADAGRLRHDIRFAYLLTDVSF
jgi:hypothetical protein